MRLKSDLFPYPVLNDNLDDFVNSSFSTKISTIKETDKKIKLIIQFYLENLDLQQLIQERKASYMIHLEGRSSAFRFQKTIDDKYSTKMELFLSSEEVPEVVEINPMIVLNQDLEGYCNDSFNPLYYGNNFEVTKLNKGSILAFESTSTLKLEFSNFEKSDAKSMIRVTKKDVDRMMVDVTGDYIIVSLPIAAYNVYVNISVSSKVHQDLVMVSIILPALTYAIERIKAGEIDEDLNWYQTIVQRVESLEYDTRNLENEDALEISQKILNNPISDTLVSYYEREESLNG